MSGGPILEKMMDEPFLSYSYRQKLIKEIQKLRGGRKLTLYIANPRSSRAMINREDIIAFEDIIRTISNRDEVDLLINSPGGDPAVAEEIIISYRNKFKSFHVIVPDYAKSAATMIALGSDAIHMGPSSELGPIDPQIQIPSPNGRIETISARAFIDMPIEKISLGIVSICVDAISAAQDFACKWLTQHMLSREPDQAKNVAKKLTEGIFYISHGKTIDFRETREELGLNVKLIDNDELWDKIWELYLRGVQFLQNTRKTKLFENEKISLAIKPTSKIFKIQKRSHPLKKKFT